MHNLAQALAQLRDQGNWYGVNQLLPYFRRAIDEYRKIGASDPDQVTRMEQLFLDLVEGGKVIGSAVGKGAQAIGTGVGSVGAGIGSFFSGVIGQLTLPLLAIAVILFLAGRRSRA
jgi:hypothetical protein